MSKTKKTAKKKKTIKSVNKEKDVLKYEVAVKGKDENVRLDSLTANLPADLPKEAREKLERIKVLLDKFQDKVVTKFQGYIMGISLLPPTQPEKGKELTQKEKDAVNVLVLLDDVDSKKMSKEDLREKLSTIMIKTGEDIDKSLKIETLLITDLWQACSDGKYDILKRIALSAPIFDRGMLSAIKISEIHKQMVLEKFEHYIVSYCLAGSLVQGKAHSKSDIDVFIVIDDTDVKKMTRVELREKLRGIIISMGMEAGAITGVQNKLNIQVWILTEFWDGLKEANPVLFVVNFL
jgi:predicted nucleotidyltransferase